MRLLALSALTVLPMCAWRPSVGPAVHALDGPTCTEAIAEHGVPCAPFLAPGDNDGDGCRDPWQRVDTDPLPNNRDYCLWVKP